MNVTAIRTPTARKCCACHTTRNANADSTAHLIGDVQNPGNIHTFCGWVEGVEIMYYNKNMIFFIVTSLLQQIRSVARLRLASHCIAWPLSASQRLSTPLNSSQLLSALLSPSQRLSAPLSTSHNKKTMCFTVSRPSPHPRPEREKCECHSDSQDRLPKVLYCRRLRFGFDDRHSTCGGTMSESM